MYPTIVTEPVDGEVEVTVEDSEGARSFRLPRESARSVALGLASASLEAAGREDHEESNL